MWEVGFFLPPTPYLLLPLFNIPRHQAAGDPEKAAKQPNIPYLSNGQGLGRLGPVGFTPHGASTPGLSTRSSSGVLTRLTLWEASSRGRLPA